MRILLSGGGTGGHVYPILAVIAALRQRVAAQGTGGLRPSGGRPSPGHRPGAPAAPSETAAAGPLPVTGPDAGQPGLVDDVEFRYVGEAGGIEQGLAEGEGIPFSAVSTGQVRGRAPWSMARNLLRMSRGAQECAALIREWRPNVVLMTGGYVAAPVAWAAARANPRVPLLIYLPDLTPGQAIRVTSRAADSVAVSFPEVVRHFGAKAVVTGYPVRADLFSTEKPQAWAALGLSAELPVLLVFGGSRGARSINRALIAALPDLLPRCQVVHATGTVDWADAQAAVAALKLAPDLAGRYHGQPYLNNMTQALVAADLAVARAGAATLGEFPAARLPAILSPYPYAGQHQEANAAYLADRGAALVIPDAELGARLKETVMSLLDRPERLQAMAEASGALARPDAADNIAGELIRLAGRMTKR